MSRETSDAVDTVLQNVKPSRRDLLKRLLIGSAAAFLLPMSSVETSAQTGNGKGKGKGKGKAKGKGTGKGKGKGKGKAKGKGTQG